MRKPDDHTAEMIQNPLFVDKDGTVARTLRAISLILSRIIKPRLARGIVCKRRQRYPYDLTLQTSIDTPSVTPLVWIWIDLHKGVISIELQSWKLLCLSAVALKSRLPGVEAATALASSGPAAFGGWTRETVNFELANSKEMEKAFDLVLARLQKIGLTLTSTQYLPQE